MCLMRAKPWTSTEDNDDVATRCPCCGIFICFRSARLCGRGPRRPHAWPALGHSLSRHAAVDCHLPPGGIGLLAPSPLQSGDILVSAGADPHRGDAEPRYRGGGPGAHGARGIHPLHPAAARPVHGGRRHRGARQPAWLAGHQYGDPGDRRSARLDHRHDGCGNDHDPPAAARQRRPQAQCACLRVLHLPRRQCRRRADAAGRPASVLGLPARGQFLLAHRALAVAGAADRWGAAGPVLRHGQCHLSQGGPHAPRSYARRRAGARTGRHQLPADRGDHRNDPAVGLRRSGRRGDLRNP